MTDPRAPDAGDPPPIRRNSVDVLEAELDRRSSVEEGLYDRLELLTRKGIEADDLFRLLVESISDYAIFMLDRDGHVATWNIGAQRIKGYSAHEIIGRHFSVFYPESDVRAGKCEMEIEGAIRTGRYEDEGWRVRKDGSQFWANVVITALLGPSGDVLGFAKITRDLTERRNNEEERAARLAAEHATRMKDEFLAMLGHELRNPLAPIVTALQLIKLRSEPRSDREYQVIERQVNHMLRLVDDLLDVSRITRGKVELQRKRFDVRDAIAKAIEIAAPLFEERRHLFDVRAPHGAMVVDGDESRLVQVFTNLLTNAAKYTEPSGNIAMTLQRTGREAQIIVEDNGNGIDPALLPRVFDLFVQGGQTAERAVGGLGLGLTLVRSLVNLHGGRVDARSRGRGLGSTFTVYLPLIDHPAAAESDNGLTAAFKIARDKLKIIVVDDNEDARLLLSDILIAIGHEVQSAGDGLGALALIKNFKPDVAILDIGLPGIDGYELAAQLRELLGDTGLRLIAVTGYGQAADRERSRSAGFDQHLVKPVELRRLLDAITNAAPASA